jgi:uncharacterized protein YecE (DUF72 family)
MNVWLGTQGWTYPDWVGSVYPDGTRQADYLALYARAFSAVEVDSTFYAVPPARTVDGWFDKTPDDFRFALKLPNEITHIRRLQDCEAVLQDFVTVVRRLGGKLAPILVQFPPDFGVEHLTDLESFLPHLPRDLSFAAEFRDSSWLRADALDLLREHAVALALSDGRWLPHDDVLSLSGRPTADFHYIRWMGADRALERFTHTQIDREAELRAWAAAIAAAPVRSVYGFANNQYAGYAPGTLQRLQQLLEIPVSDPRAVWDQTALF